MFLMGEGLRFKVCLCPFFWGGGMRFEVCLFCWGGGGVRFAVCFILEDED